MLLCAPDGSARPLSPRQLRAAFGIGYAATLILPARLPRDLLAKCAEAGARTARALGPRRLSAVRRRLAAASPARAYVAWAGAGVGFGLFAARGIKRDEMIGEYAGVLTTDWEPAARSPGAFNPYLFKFPFDTPYAIDARERGNELRFANHSRRTANARRAYVLHGGVLRAVLLAARMIARHEQILFDYGRGYRLAARLRELGGGSGAGDP